MRCALILLLLLTSCSWRPNSPEYRHYYSYLKEKPCGEEHLPKQCVLFFVSARHLDYSTPEGFLQSLCKHPSDGTMNGDVGHAWVQLHSPDEDLIAGHSGETGAIQPKYFDGVVELAALGDPNPVRYLWATQFDGFLQQGTGGHTPTFAAFKEVTDEQYKEIRKLFFRPKDYWKEYRLIDRHCVNFVYEVAKVLRINLECSVNIDLPCHWQLGTLWQDETYSSISIATPDALEKSLVREVKQGNLSCYTVSKPGYKCDITFERARRFYKLHCGMSRSK